MNSTANYGQVLTLAHGTARDKVASVLMRVVNQLSAHGELQTDLPSPTATWRSSRTSSGPGQPGAEGARQNRRRGARLPPHPLPEPLFSSYRHLLEGRLPTTTQGRSASLPALRAMCRSAQLTSHSLSSGTHLALCIPWDTGRARALRAAGEEPRSLPSRGRPQEEGCYE